MAKVQTVWKHRPASQFQGARLEVVADVVVFDTLGALEGLSRDGTQLWKLPEPGIEFYGFRGDIYGSGTRARRIEPKTGAILAEKEFGTDVRVFHPTLDAVPYSGKRPMSFFGLHPQDLSTVWEWPDRQQEFTAHDRQLCRYRKTGDITIVDLATKQERTIPAPALAEVAALHAHMGDLWCHFCCAIGDRFGIDTRTGEVAWRFTEAEGHGLVVFDEDKAYGGFPGLSAWSLRTGERAWHQDFGNPQLSTMARPFLSNGRVYMSTDDGMICVLEAATGKVLLSHKLDYKATGLGFEPSPVVPLGENRIVAGTRRAIYCLEVS